MYVDMFLICTDIAFFSYITHAKLQDGEVESSRVFELQTSFWNTLMET